MGNDTNRHIIIEDENVTVAYNNGTIFIARRVVGAPQFTIAALVEAGANDDIIRGTGHFFEHIPFGKTENFQDERIFSFMQERGGNVRAYTTYDRTVYHGEVKKGHEYDAILAISDLVCRPVFEKDRILAEQETILDEWAHGEMDVARRVSRLLTKTAFGENSAFLPVIGSDETIMQIGLAQVQTFFATNYLSNRLIVAMEGDCDPHQLIDNAIAKFTLPNGLTGPAFQAIEIGSRTEILSTDQRATKVNILLQGPFDTAGPEEKIAAFVLGQMLFGTAGTVMKEMRFDRRLVYAVGVPDGNSFSETNYAFDAVAFDAFPAKVPKAIDAFGHGVLRFFQNPDADLFQQIKNHRVAAIEEGNRRIPEITARSLAYNAFARKVAISKETGLTAFRKLQLQDVLNAAHRIFSRGTASVLYTGQHRDHYQTHSDIIEMLRSATTGTNITTHQKLKDITPTT